MARSRVSPFAQGSTIIGLLIRAALAVGLSAFASRAAESTVRTPRFPDHVDSGQVAPSNQSATMPDTVEWRFSEPQPDWKPGLPLPDVQPPGLERTSDALRLILSDGPRASGPTPRNRTLSASIYVDLPDWRREQWTEVVVRARTTAAVSSMAIGLDPPAGATQGTFRARGGVTPIVRDGLVHTYRIFLDWGNQPTGPWRRVGLHFQVPVRVPAPVFAGIDILSVRVVPATAGQDRVTETMLEPSQVQSDFALFRRALEEAHPALYRYTTKRALDAEFARAEAKLSRRMTVLEFHNVLAPVLAVIKDGHTHLTRYQGDEIGAIIASAKLFPLALNFESTRGFVLLNEGRDERVKPGMEVLAINGQSLAEILKRILPNLTSDGDVESWPRYQLGISRGIFQRGASPYRTGFAESYRLFIANPASFRTTLRDPKTRQTVVVDLAGVTIAEAAVNAEANPVNRDVLAGLDTLRHQRQVSGGSDQSIRYFDDEVTALLIPQWDRTSPVFLKETFAELRGRGTKNLIIDVRGNTGGFDQIPVLLFSYLTSKEFLAIEGNRVNTFQPSFQQYTTLPTVDLATDSYFGPASGLWKPDPQGGWLMTEKYPSIGMQKPSENPFSGSVYVLIDGGGFSATPAFTVLADYYKRATFIGEEVGGSGSGGAGADIGPTLPESRIHLGMSMESYFSVVDRNPRRRGTLPKYPVMQTIDDLAKGRDTVLEFTRELIRSGKGR